MTAIVLIVTNLGRQALVNAAAGGTNAVRIVSVGISSINFAANAILAALPGEFKRLATVSGATVDADTIHLVVRDESADTYALRSFMLYLSDGSSFAVYSQADPILEKSVTSTALLAVDIRFADINAATLTFGNANFLNPPATTEVAGVVELATPAEALEGTDPSRAIAPSGLKAYIDARFGAGSASAFVKTLLTTATAAAFRTLLGIKSAALKDEGQGNGLDADKLRGLVPLNPAGFAGGAYPFIPVVGNFGYMEVGSAIDFHASNADAADNAVRLSVLGEDLVITGAKVWNSRNDGSGSGLDADLLDGQDSSFYTNIVARLGFAPYPASNPNGYINSTGTSGFTPWHPGNDGSGSGLDADLLDGQDSSYFTNISARLGYTPYNAVNPAGYISGISGSMVVGALGYTPWHAGNDGAGSGLDADLLDGRDASSFAGAAHSHDAAALAPAFASRLLAESGYQVFPGGFIIQWGQVRNYFASEQSVGVDFPIPFPNALLSVSGTTYIIGNNIQRDLTIQVTSQRDQNGAVFFLQADDNTGNFADGFDWIAFGW